MSMGCGACVGVVVWSVKMLMHMDAHPAGLRAEAGHAHTNKLR